MLDLQRLPEAGGQCRTTTRGPVLSRESMGPLWTRSKSPTDAVVLTDMKGAHPKMPPPPPPTRRQREERPRRLCQATTPCCLQGRNSSSCNLRIETLSCEGKALKEGLCRYIPDRWQNLRGSDETWHGLPLCQDNNKD